MALTEKQRGLILTRDGFKSQLLHYNEEKGWHREGYCGISEGCPHLHVHHIQPTRVLRAEGKGRHQIDVPSNLLTLHQCEHTGICPSRKLGHNEKYVSPDLDHPVIHEDIQWATENYEGKNQFDGVKGRTSFDVVMELRGEALKEGEEYWDGSWDIMMRGIADERTRCKAAEGWRFKTIRDR